MALKTEDIVRILQLRGMGRKTAKKFCELDFNGTGLDLIDFILEASDKKLLQRLPDYERAEIITAFKKGDGILDKSERANVKITSYFDKKFPKALLDITDPPLVISTKGNLADISSMTGVAVIGTRQPSQAGVKAGEYFGKQLALQNFNVVSGLAIGCDASGHRGCLSVNGFTTAILAHGLQTIYPKENFSLAEEILDKGGVLLTEYLMGTGALPNYFVERDRLQAGLSEATIVIQTDEKGGTMHAVNATLASKKALAAIKYKGVELEYSKTKGNEKLIREGKAFALTSDNLVEFISLFKTISPIQSGQYLSSSQDKNISPPHAEISTNVSVPTPLIGVNLPAPLDNTNDIPVTTVSGGSGMETVQRTGFESGTIATNVSETHETEAVPSVDAENTTSVANVSDVNETEAVQSVDAESGTTATNVSDVNETEAVQRTDAESETPVSEISETAAINNVETHINSIATNEAQFVTDKGTKKGKAPKGKSSKVASKAKVTNQSKLFE